MQHGDLVGELGGERDVVRDEDERQAVLAHQLVEQGDELLLHDGVERAGRLVGDQERRVDGERGGERDALPLAAGEFVRVVAHALAGARDAHAFEKIGGARGAPRTSSTLRARRRLPPPARRR